MLLINIRILRCYSKQRKKKIKTNPNHGAEYDHSFQSTWILIQLLLEVEEKLQPTPAWPIWHPSSIAPHWNHGTEQNSSLLLLSPCSWILVFCIDTLCPLQYSIKIQKQTVSKKQFQQAFTSPHPKILRTTAFKLLLNSEFSRTIHQ